jgi:RNA polymerase sigma-70 factor, ECF subfamily
MLDGFAERVERILAAARLAWPGVELDPDSFLEDLRRRSPVEGLTAEHIDQLHAVDLVLACACARGDRAAIALLDQRLLPRVDRAVARIDPRPDFIDEVRQELRCRLLLGPEARIGAYSGSGPLASWLCVVAMRTALNAVRARQAGSRLEPGPEPPPPPDDPEGRAVVAHHREDTRRALHDALAALPDAGRRLLDLHYVQALTLEEIGARCGLHRSTVSRRLTALTARVLDEVKRLLAARLRATDATVESLIRAMREDIEISVSALAASWPDVQP